MTRLQSAPYGLPTASAPAREDSLIALRARVDALERQYAELLALVHRLVGAGARDQEDVRVVAGMYEYATILMEHFTTSQIIAWPRLELAAALRRADVVDAKGLGELLHRLRGRNLDGLVVERLKSGRAGAHWRVRDLRQPVSPTGPGSR